MIGETTHGNSGSRGPMQRLMRKLARKQRMIEEYERIARETDVSQEQGRATRDYFLKRAADFRTEQKALETQIEEMAARRRRPASAHENGIAAGPARLHSVVHSHLVKSAE